MKTDKRQSTSGIRRPTFFVFLLSALLLRAPALLRVADNLPLDSPRRAICLAAMRPIASFSHLTKLDTLCTTTESFERKNLE